jgi:glycosyltransferase involved in cell wall biosynthesis
MQQRPASHDISFVMPVRNCEHDIVDRVEALLLQLSQAEIANAEIVVVDDGSQDQTCDRLHDLQTRRSRLRILRHDRPRGLESAGQTGLERAVGRIVFICEDEYAVRLEDLCKLLQLAEDDSIVAARAESKSLPPSAPLIRRLRSWGTDAEQRIAPEQHESQRYSSLQMIRRPHLKHLCSPSGHHLRLQTSTATDLTISRSFTPT